MGWKHPAEMTFYFFWEVSPRKDNWTFPKMLGTPQSDRFSIETYGFGDPPV